MIDLQKEEVHLLPQHRLNRLGKYLNYEISTVILYILSFQVFVFLFVAASAALILTPYMLYVLFKEDKKIWLVMFGVIVIIPTLFLLLFSIIDHFLKPLILLSLALFYLYCFLLRFDVNNWIAELRAKNIRILNDRRKNNLLDV